MTKEEYINSLDTFCEICTLRNECHHGCVSGTGQFIEPPCSNYGYEEVNILIDENELDKKLKEINEKDDDMSYPCTLNQSKECDGCNECHAYDYEVVCENCECGIPEGEMYFEIGKHALCKDCMEAIYGRYA